MSSTNHNQRARYQLDADDLEYEQNIPDVKKVGICAETGKKKIRSESKAAAVARQMRVQNRDPFIESYACPHCSAWHVGHSIGTQQRRKELAEQFGQHEMSGKNRRKS